MSPLIAGRSLIDFVNLKIKMTQCFKGAHRGRIYMHIFIGVSVVTCMSNV
jgi:hypothetical protein